MVLPRTNQTMKIPAPGHPDFDPQSQPGCPDIIYDYTRDCYWVHPDGRTEDWFPLTKSDTLQYLHESNVPNVTRPHERYTEAEVLLAEVRLKTPWPTQFEEGS